MISTYGTILREESIPKEKSCDLIYLSEVAFVQDESTAITEVHERHGHGIAMASTSIFYDSRDVLTAPFETHLQKPDIRDMLES